MMPSVMGWKRVGVAIVACSGMACASQPVEPRVSVAFERGLERYPERLRGKLEGIGLAREPDYGVPEDSPLMMRLMGEAAYAFFSTWEQQVVILDAGLAERAAWTGGDASREEVAGLMGDLASALDAPAGDVEAQWETFAATVQGWSGEQPIEGEIRFGDERVLDRFVRLGVGRALARDWEDRGALDLDSQMIHELAHALQLSGQGAAVSAHLHAWGTLSGWVRADRNEPFDGFHSGMMMMEQPAVLGRLLLSGERGEGLYAHAPGARFVNLYAAYDAREDYAESVRLFFERPDRLLEIAPEKFLFINALGYNARLDLVAPGPLWIGEAEIVERGWQAAVQAAAAELLSGREGITVDPRTVASLLRAHQGVLRADGLPRREVYRGVAADVPRELADLVRMEDFSVELDGIRFGPEVGAVEELLADMVVGWHENDEFYRDLDTWLDPEPQGLEEEFIELGEQQNPQLRAMQAARFLEKAWGFVADARYAEMGIREVSFQRRAGHDLLAEALLVRMAISRGGQMLHQRLERYPVDRDAAGYDEIELRTAIVEGWFASGDPERAAIVARTINGDWWGMIRRTRAMCRAAQVTGRSELLDVCAEEVSGAHTIGLAEYLGSMISDAKAAIDAAEDSE